MSKSILHVFHLNVHTNAAVNTFIIHSPQPFPEIMIWMLTLFSGTTLDVGYSDQNNEVPRTALDIDKNCPKVNTNCPLDIIFKWFTLIAVLDDTNVRF